MDKSSPHTFRIPDKLYEKLKKKAGYIPIPVVIRQLIKRYVNDEIGLEDEKNSNP